MLIARIAAVAVGLLLVVWVLDAAIRTFLLPRASRVRLARWIAKSVGMTLTLVAPPSSSYPWRDKVHAMRPPLTLLAFQSIWLFIVYGGFTLLFWGLADVGAGQASRYSGSALFTFGFASPPGTGIVLVAVYAEAVIGLTLLALLISFLPTIYAAFQRREFVVAKLAARAGSPSTPWHALALAHENDSVARMDAVMWGDWEDWFIDIGESHRSLVILSFYRSPDPNNHWISAARTILDLAALRTAAVDIPTNVAPRLTMRSGSIVLRAIDDYFHLPHPTAAAPPGHISITRAQFDAACDYMEVRNVPLKPDRDQAWTEFAGWRANYDEAIEAAATAFNAPPNPWHAVSETITPGRPTTGHRRRNVPMTASRETGSALGSAATSGGGAS